MSKEICNDTREITKTKRCLTKYKILPFDKTIPKYLQRIILTFLFLSYTPLGNNQQNVIVPCIRRRKLGLCL